ncbi:MAG: acetoacetate--CoA ligase [Gammaproteobacteria bacterium]
MTDALPIWRPTPTRVQGSQMTAFARLAAARHGIDAADPAGLHRWSVREPAQFWALVWEFTGVHARRAADRILEGGDRMPGARWFQGAELNFTENLLRAGDAGDPALIARDESGRRRVLTRAGLRAAVDRFAAALRNFGVGPGDRVAALMPNVPEAVIGALGATAVGATWSSAAPEFGAAAVVDRFSQLAPRVLLCANGYRYGGRSFELGEKIARIATALPGLAAIVAVNDPAFAPLAGARIVDFEALDATGGAPGFAALPFDHPLYVLYSSGTTGKPKCIVHGAGGTLLQHLKEHRLHVDLRAGDALFYYTTCGWMMWNWLVSGLASGATLALYDGHPSWPHPHVLIDVAREESIAIFGVSARYLAALEKAGAPPAPGYRLDRLRTVLSTGSPLLPAQYDWFYRVFGEQPQLASMSGGTDIVSCFVCGHPNLPVHRGEIQCAGLGMDVRVFDPAGRDLATGTGELVCATPFPSMPLGFLGDADGTRFRRAYFDRYPGVWAHGDFAERTAAGGFVIHGRSDTVLNPGGVRIGSAEIYRQVEPIDEVVECIAVGQAFDGDERIVLFVRLREGLALDDALRDRIRDALRRHASPRHVPAKILQAADLPRTLSGKLVEQAVRDAIHGRPIGNRDALANPESLDWFRDLPELRD